MQKYKVFLNEKRIVFSSNRNITLSKPISTLDENAGIEGVAEFLQGFEKSTITETVLEHENPSQLLEKFKSAFLMVNAAGGVVQRNGEFLFIFRNGKWDLPKGKIDEGETPDIAALREVEEECGIAGHAITQQIQSSFHIYKSPYPENFGKWIFKETLWFEMVYEGEYNGCPQHEDGISEVRWFKPSELNIVLDNTYENLKEIILAYRD
jgi:8-oxo-dGTP pyrophosphatase MutT (NUDIX family)